MISMMRIDDRLIHGQVAVMWSKELGISRIIVASDAIASNEIQVSALKMAAPAGVKAEMIHQPLPGDERQDFMKLLGGK